MLVAFKFHQPGYKPQAATFTKGTFGAAVHKTPEEPAEAKTANEAKATEEANATGEDDVFWEEDAIASRAGTTEIDLPPSTDGVT